MNVEIRNNGGFDNYEVIIIENYPCNNSNEAKIRERFWNETLNAIEKPIQKPVFTKEEKEEVEKVFNAFYKTNYTVNHPEIDGIGLGLSIAKRLCDVLNVELVLTSEENQGTEVTLII